MLFIDHGYPEVLEPAFEFANSGTAAAVEIVERPNRIGCTNNTLEALTQGFYRAEQVIHLEDDTVPLGPDFLRYMEWAFEEYRNDQEIFSVCGYNRVGVEWVFPEHFYTASRKCWFIPWGWGTWRDRWQSWLDAKIVCTAACSWDMWLGGWATDHGLQMLYPALPRIQNIGACGGQHVPNAEWHERHHFNAFGSWSLATTPAGIWSEKR